MPSAREREDSATEMKTAYLIRINAGEATCASSPSENGTRVRSEGNRADAAHKYGKGATVR